MKVDSSSGNIVKDPLSDTDKKETFESTLNVDLLVKDVFEGATLSDLRLQQGSPLEAYRIALKIPDPVERDDCLMRCAEQMWSMENSQSQLLALKMASNVSDTEKRNEWYADLALQTVMLGDEDLACSVLERVTPGSRSEYVEFVRKNIEKT